MYNHAMNDTALSTTIISNALPDEIAHYHILSYYWTMTQIQNQYTVAIVCAHTRMIQHVIVIYSVKHAIQTV